MPLLPVHTEKERKLLGLHFFQHNLRPQRNVRWVKDTFGNAQPAWPTEPSLAVLESIARKHLNVPVNAPCSVSLFAEGGFNKLYAVDNGAYLIRVALPVEPCLKTLSEVATIAFVRVHASELVPRVLAYSPEDSELGFEWMIMEKLPGDVLEERWEDMDWEARVVLVKTIVGVLSKLYDQPLSGIGNIYPDDMATQPPIVGRIVSMMFFWDGHFDDQDVPRGPFRSSHDWLGACLQLILNDAAKVLSEPLPDDDEDAHDEAQQTRALAERLLCLLPRIFLPFSANAPSEMTILHHDDISHHNLLVDTSGKLTGIIDWECVSTLPLWRACTMPSFLTGRSRNQQPDVCKYAKEAESSRPNELYFDHLREWEQTRLRAVFLEEMGRIQPAWVRTYREGVLKNDFFEAVMRCSDELCRKRVHRWVDRVEIMSDEGLRGGPGPGYESLRDAFMA